MSGPCVPSDGDLQHARNVAIAACLQADPECIRLVKDAEAVSHMERRRWSELRRPWQGDSTRLATEARLLFAAAEQRVEEAEDRASRCRADGEAGNTARSQAAYWRVFRYVASEDFRKAVWARDWETIAENVAKEIGLAVTINNVSPYILSCLELIKEKLTPFLTKLPESVTVAAPHVLVFVAFCVFSPRGTGSWEDLGVACIVAALQTCLVSAAPIWTTIVVTQFLGDFGSQRAALIRDGYTGNATVAAAKGAFLMHPVVGWARGVWDYFYGTDPGAVDASLLHLDEFIHEEFEDGLELKPLVDPVFLHGYAFSRSSIDKHFAKLPSTRKTHPYTREPIRRVHVLKPPTEFLRLRAEYLRRRDVIIRDYEAGAADHPHAD